MSTTNVASLPTIGTWNIDGLHSTVGFSVSHNVVATFRASFLTVTGSLENGVLTGSVPVDSLELGLYVAFQPDAPAGYTDTATLTEGTGFKERLKYRLAEAGQWPIDVALYGELVEYTTEFEIEANIILERRFGKLRIAANAWAELEFEYQGNRDWVLNPTAGATYQILPEFHAGL